MNESEMLKLPVETVEEIDKSRGRMNRPDFICYLIRNHNSTQGRGQTYVTTEEFHEFQRWMKELFRSFLDFFVALGLKGGVRPQRKKPGLFPAPIQADGWTDGRAARHRNGKGSSGL